MCRLLVEAQKQSNGTRGFPAGTRPSVGVSGFIMGGGFGGYTRYAGLGADQIIGFKAVDAQGDLLDVGSHNHTALLWASRGGGGGKFAIVTDWHVRLMDVSTGVTNFNYTIPYDKVGALLAAGCCWLGRACCL
jgi:FAD/FMN-containing dehydrogenase